MNQQEAVAWVADIFQEPSDNVSVDTPRIDIPGWDSLGVLSLMAEMDEAFDIQLEEEQLADMQSVQDIIAILTSHGILKEES